MAAESARHHSAQPVDHMAKLTLLNNKIEGLHHMVQLMFDMLRMSRDEACKHRSVINMDTLPMLACCVGSPQPPLNVRHRDAL